MNKQTPKIVVEQLENKNQFVIVTPQGYYFQSYNSLIALWDGEDLTLWKMWDYSQTTLKHLKIFINTYTPLNMETKSDIQRAINKGKITYIND